MLNNYFDTHQYKWIPASAKPFAIWFALLLLVQAGSGQTPLNVWHSNGPNARITSVVTDPINPNIVYAATANSDFGLFKSINNGASWSASNEGFGIGNLNISSIVINPGNPNILYAGTTNGVFRTTNAAATWDRTYAPVGLFPTLAIARSDPRIVFAKGFSNSERPVISVTTDGGYTWSERPSPETFGWILAVDPQNPLVLYYGVDNYEDYFSTLYKSVDGGISWQVLFYRDSGGLITHALKIDPVSPNIIYSATYGGLYKTTDGGARWTLRGSPSPAYGLIGLAINPLQPGNLYASVYQGGVYKSTNDGATWSAFNNGLTNLNVGALELDSSGTTLHVATESGVFSVRVRGDAATVSVSGRVIGPDGRGLRNATVSITDSLGVRRTVTTSSFGFYSFENIRGGEAYTIAVSSRLYRFASRAVQVENNLSDVDFVGIE